MKMGPNVTEIRRKTLLRLDSLAVCWCNPDNRVQMDVGVQLSRLSLAQRFQLRLFDLPFFYLPFSTPRNLTVGQVSHFPCVRDPSLLLKNPSPLLAAQAICIFFSLNVMAILVSLFDSGGDCQQLNR
jgi:hypothetical protein